MEQPIWNFEQEHGGEPGDETSVNLRAYFDRMPDEKMLHYRPEWTDAQVLAWDENFRDDNILFIACCERDIEVGEYRQVMEQSIAYRDRVRGKLVGQAG